MEYPFKVVVYIVALTPDQCSERILNIQRAFSSDLFQVLVRYIPPPPNLTPSSTMTSNDQLAAFRFTTILNEAQNNFPNQYMIYILENSVTLANSEIIANTTFFAIINNGVFEIDPDKARWEILYYTRWLDACYDYDPETTLQIPNTSQFITNSDDTLGFQCYLISPLGRQMLLGLQTMFNDELFTPIIYAVDTQINLAVMTNGMRRWVTVPNIFEYDVTWNPNSYNLNTSKTYTCKPDFAEQEEGFNYRPLIIFVVGVIFLFIVGWALLVIGPQDWCYKRKRNCCPNKYIPQGQA